ncbi:futalosine hydrolase [Mucilaginibacter robiniae]|uniref:Futalosine hydrolase n=1 Tax=Mucilaginibacter robiniae TaxID=2728022 RepID=A0A7L5E2N0_9SPHI|nr:futalosine hydrolase [Mucilaginibacter robiniae]QJD96808.1 futalosine hydrolase [Mucilaginibacter robiniae]
MKILVVAATRPEIEPLMSGSKERGAETPSIDGNGQKTNQAISDSFSTTTDFLITGVGMVATAFALGRQLASHSYDLAINLGIAGSFDRDIALGEVVEITHDNFAELGAEDDENFLTLDSMGFGQTAYTTTTRLNDYYREPTVRQVFAITVNTVHGNEQSIAKMQQRINPQLESMEGAAFFYACAQAGVPALQIRAVSNYVEKRNREAWKIGLAVKNLNTFAGDLLRVVSSR